VRSTGLTSVRRHSPETSNRDREACVEAKQVVVAGHPSDGAMKKISGFTLEGHVSLIS
jgi:hypothetical protein